MNNKVTFGPASWIGLVGAICAAVAPVITENVPGQTGAIIAAVLAAVVILGRQAQAVVNTIYAGDDFADEMLYAEDIPDEPTDVHPVA